MSAPFQNANFDAWTFNSKGMFAIGWLELGEPDRALLLLEKCFKNIQGPFQVLEQSADNTGGGPVLRMLTTPPLTGVERIVGRLRGGKLPHWDGGIPAGGAVWLHGVQVSRGSTVKKESVEQTAVKQWILIFVCLGARVQRECLVFSPLLPSDASELCIRGVSYLGHQMDWLLRKDEVCVILREQPGGGAAAQDCDLQVVLKASGSKFPLKPGNDKYQKGRAASSCLIHRNKTFMFTQLY